MPRANRYFVPGQVYHLTHRCHDRQLVGLRQRFRILDLDRVLELLGGVNATAFREHYEELINERIAKDELKREAQWTEAIRSGIRTVRA